MDRIPLRITILGLVLALTGIPGSGWTQKGTAWLDQAKPDSWNEPGAAIPAAPKVANTLDARCRNTARPAELEEDRRLRDLGWDLVGPYQGGWEVRVIGGTAGYDGMCRPRQYQNFVFVRGVFAGTLSPQPMDSRSDGAVSRVSLQGSTELTAEYVRYAPADPRCCPSRTTSVVFEILWAEPVVRPVSISTSQTP